MKNNTQKKRGRNRDRVKKYIYVRQREKRACKRREKKTKKKYDASVMDCYL